MIYVVLKDNVAIVTLDSTKGNLLQYDDLLMLQSFLCCDEVKKANGLILTGMNRSFCTGLDIKNSAVSVSSIFKKLDEILVLLYSYENPLIVASSGHAIGAGFLFLLCADYVYVPKQPKIKFGLPEINIGLGLDDLMVLLVKTVFSPQETKKILYSGSYFNCEELFDFELIDCFVENNELVDYSLNVINYSILNKKESFMHCKKILRKTTIEQMVWSLKNRSYNELSILYKKNNEV